MTTIRPLKNNELPLLDDFLYLAIFIPEGVQAPPRDIINQPELRVYVDGFGSQPDDHCIVAECDGAVVGAVWVRDMPDFGHIADGVPSFAISVKPEYRGRGIGTNLMRSMLDHLRQRGYKKASLSVQKANYAARMYQKLGFRTIGENDEEYIMVYEF
jgi:ribosomal protein S18 acetylase RimI-like enzyme